MRKTEELANPTSCLNKAHPQELLFVLLARDPAAVVVVRMWTEVRVALGLNEWSDAQITEALHWVYKANLQRNSEDFQDHLSAYKAQLQTLSPEGFNKQHQGTWEPPTECRICAAQGIHGEPLAPGVEVCYDHAVRCRICDQPCDPERPHTCKPVEGPYEQTR